MFKKILMTLGLLALGTLASAQYSGYKFPGGSFTAPLVGPDGDDSAPTFAFTTNPDQGCWYDTTLLDEPGGGMTCSTSDMSDDIYARLDLWEDYDTVPGFRLYGRNSTSSPEVGYIRGNWSGSGSQLELRTQGVNSPYPTAVFTMSTSDSGAGSGSTSSMSWAVHDYDYLSNNTYAQMTLTDLDFEFETRASGISGFLTNVLFEYDQIYLRATSGEYPTPTTENTVTITDTETTFTDPIGSVDSSAQITFAADSITIDADVDNDGDGTILLDAANSANFVQVAASGISVESDTSVIIEWDDGFDNTSQINVAGDSIIIDADLDDDSDGAVYVRANNAASQVQVDTTGVNISGPFVVAQVAYASLPTATDGTIIYCTDCTEGGTCAGSGDGAFAFASDGAWECPW